MSESVCFSRKTLFQARTWYYLIVGLPDIFICCRPRTYNIKLNQMARILNLFEVDYFASVYQCHSHYYYYYYYYYYLACEAIGTAATPGLLCQPRVIVKVIVEK
jgi:hypothetical protein